MKGGSRTWRFAVKGKRLGARLSIWSIRRHDAILSVLRMSMWSFSGVVLLAAVVGRLDLQTALRVIAFGGLAVVVLLTGLALTRRNVLLAIDDPDLRAEAHQAMLSLMRSRMALRPAAREERDSAARSEAGNCPQGPECGF